MKNVKKIEKCYNIQFPNSLKSFLKEILPIGNGFYNWRNFDTKNIEHIKSMIIYPKEYIYIMADEIDWCVEWGNEPSNSQERRNRIADKASNAPILIPIYLHRYMPMYNANQIPIISVSQTDIIYYGKNLENYFINEFGDKPEWFKVISDYEYIPFWSDIM